MKIGSQGKATTLMCLLIAAITLTACESTSNTPASISKPIYGWTYHDKIARLRSNDGRFEVNLIRLESGATIATIAGFAMPAELRDAPPGSKLESDVSIAFNGNVQTLRMHRFDPSQGLTDTYIDDLDLFLAHVVDVTRMTISYEGQLATFDGFDRLIWK